MNDTTTKTTNRQRLDEYKARRKEAGFCEMRSCVHSDLIAHLAKHRRSGECQGRTLERLILGEARPRPPYWTEGERKKQRGAGK